MNREKGIAFCGLACCLCNENKACAGCRNDGCVNKEWCKSFNCCREKKIDGCWQCDDFEICDNFMLKKLKVNAFAEFIKKYGEEKMYECLESNEKNGIIYHHDGKITGDYDELKTTEEIFSLLLNGSLDFSNCK